MVYGSSQPDADEANLVVHHLQLEPASEQDIKAAVEEIQACFCCDKVCFDSQRHVLNIAYNASRHDLPGINILLSKHNLHISHDWWTHSREGYRCLIDTEKQEKRRQ